MARLPTPGEDEGTWGSILNDYLAQTHQADGTLKDNVVTSAALAPDAVDANSVQDESVTTTKIADSAITEVKLDAALQAKVNGVGAGANLSAIRTATTVVVASDSGTDATLVAADGTNAGVMVAADKTKLDGIATGAQANTVDSVASKTGVVTLDKNDVGLGNVDNTSDASKPVSTATQTALDGKASTATTDALDARVDTLESAGIVTLTDAVTIATDASAGKHFRVTVAGDRTLGAPTNAVDGMRKIWEITASAADRSITLATGTAGSFELTTDITSPITVTSGGTHFLGAVYNASRGRWTVLASRATT